MSKLRALLPSLKVLIFGKGLESGPEHAIAALRNVLAHTGGEVCPAAAYELLVKAGHEARVFTMLKALDPIMSRLQIWLPAPPRLLQGARPDAILSPEPPPSSIEGEGPTLLFADDTRVMALEPLCTYSVPELPRMGLPALRGRAAVPQIYYRLDSDALLYLTFDPDVPVSRSLPQAAHELQNMLPTTATHPWSILDHLRVGREQELQHIIERISSSSSQFLWLEGRPGSGKSVLLASVAQAILELGDRPIWVSAGGCEGVLSFLEHFQAAVKAYSIEIDAPATGQKHLDLVEQLTNALTNVANYSQPLIVFLDDLDDLAHNTPDELKSLLARFEAIPGVIWVLAGRLEFAALLPAQRARALFDEGGLPNMTESDLRALALTRLGGMAPEALVDSKLLDTLVKQATGLPLYLELACADIKARRVALRYATVDLPLNLERYHDRLLRRYRMDERAAVLGPILAFLALVRDAATPKLLIGWLLVCGLVTREKAAQTLVNDVLARLGPMVSQARDTTGQLGYRLFHETFRQKILSGEQLYQAVATGRETLRVLIKEWDSPRAEPVRDYLLRHGIGHLLTQGQLALAAELLRTPSFARAVLDCCTPHALQESCTLTQLALEHHQHRTHRSLRDGSTSVRPPIEEQGAVSELKALADVLRLDAALLEQDACALMGCLQRRCGFLDSTQPAMALLERWKQEWVQDGLPWLESKTPPQDSVGSGLLLHVSHEGESVAWSPDGSKIATSKALYLASTGEKIASFSGPSLPGLDTGFNQDGTKLWAGSCDGWIQIHDAETFSTLHQFKLAKGYAQPAAFHPYRPLVAAACHKGELCLIDLNSNTLHWKLTWQGRASLVAFVDESTILVTLAHHQMQDLHTIRLLDLEGNTIHSGEHKAIRSAAVCLARNLLATALFGQPVVQLRELTTLAVQRTINVFDDSVDPPTEAPQWNRRRVRTTESLALSSNGKLLAAGDNQGHISLWNLDQERCVQAFDFEHDRNTSGQVQGLAFAPDGTQIAAVSHALKVWSLGLDSSSRPTPFTHNNSVRDLARHPSKPILASGDWDGRVVLWDLHACKPTEVLERSAGVEKLAWGPRGELLAGVGFGPQVTLWCAGKVRHLQHGNPSGFRTVAFGPSYPPWLITGDEDGEVKRWEIDSGINTTIAQHTEGPVWAVAISSDGRLVASTSKQAILVHELSPNLLLATIPYHAHRLAWSPDGKLYGQHFDSNTASCWNSETQRHHRVILPAGLLHLQPLITNTALRVSWLGKDHSMWIEDVTSFNQPWCVPLNEIVSGPIAVWGDREPWLAIGQGHKVHLFQVHLQRQE